jgi:alpha-amylase/alpha-mannosidase (GH57 family)
MAELSLAFLWHQHQPYYPDDVAGTNSMPWVRLHGVKDYYGMALHLLEFPEMRCAINLVPSLLVQIQDYVEHNASDQFLDIARKPAASLTEADATFLLDHYFMANLESMIKPIPRFYELYLRRNAGKRRASDVLHHFTPVDLLDLQTLFNLAWIHPLAFELDPELRLLRDKGRSFSEDEKALVLDKHLSILRLVLPMHRKLFERGQIELTTTPFYHPILPLLLDKKLARAALPDIALPAFTGGYPEDAQWHVRRAVEAHRSHFGHEPRGMWPAEGSVCQAMIPLLTQHGIRWIATDEEVLARSTDGYVGREQGQLRNPAALYRPYRVRENGSELCIVFRDHELSDKIGFHYQRWRGEEAAADFFRHLQGIRQSVEGQHALVCIILDGENCWEHYPDGGVSFLRSLYRLCTQDAHIHPVRLGEHLEQHPPHDVLPHLFAGSWINHNFRIWVGHQEDNTAWDLLHRTREHLVARGASGNVPSDKLERAWREIYIAEGSDWFWWYGDDHSSAQDDLFDSLFRKHLENVYHFLGEPAPADLQRTIRVAPARLAYTAPHALLDVKVDGRASYFEWLGAGRYRAAAAPAGAMTQVAHGPLVQVLFGFDLAQLFIRIDFDQPAKLALVETDRMEIVFHHPREFRLIVHEPGRAARVQGATGTRIAVDEYMEIAIPFDTLGAEVEELIEFHVQLVVHDQIRDRAPRDGALAVTRPSSNFARIHWI